jgi:hypothetical protein
MYGQTILPSRVQVPKGSQKSWKREKQEMTEGKGTLLGAPEKKCIRDRMVVQRETVKK